MNYSFQWPDLLPTRPLDYQRWDMILNERNLKESGGGGLLQSFSADQLINDPSLPTKATSAWPSGTVWKHPTDAGHCAPNPNPVSMKQLVGSTRKDEIQQNAWADIDWNGNGMETWPVDAGLPPTFLADFAFCQPLPHVPVEHKVWLNGQD